MSKTRDNHYVPEWYQKGFWERGQRTLAYLNLAPETFRRSDGSIGHKRALHDAPPSRAFVQTDLYSTFFGSTVDDEIERKLFGDIDTRGAIAIRAFAKGDQTECHRNFENFFEYIDAQKLRTPKGLDWLRAQYPFLSQNGLMEEMQAMRMMHCTIWTGGVREIVSAENSDVKFILSDHPVTVFNPGAPPGSKINAPPLEPGIELKGTQTLFPLDRNHCLILTNLEYAQDRSVDLLSKRTFAGRFRNSIVNTHAFIRSRKLITEDVQAVNQIIRSGAKQFVAAGNKNWFLEAVTDARTWRELGEVLMPPPDELFGFGGEMYVRYENGEVDYQDAFGRTEKEREFLKKPPSQKPLKSSDPCGCGSGKAYAKCCKQKAVNLRPTWDTLSIRERNLALFRGIEDILELRPDQNWVEVRKSITDEKISKIYSVYAALWPLETDLLALLPKPDGAARAVYTGMLDARTIRKTAIGSPLLFGEVLIQHPFINPRTVKDEYNPVKNPQPYRQEVLKSVLLFLQLQPLIEAGMINLFPDPWDFDHHLRQQTMYLAKERGRIIRPLIAADDSGFKDLASEDFRRTLYQLSEDGQRKMLKRYSPELDADQIEDLLRGFEVLKEEDPYAVLQEGAQLDSENGGQYAMLKLTPNFEMTMYVAQATGASIITDHPVRWKELLISILMRHDQPTHQLLDLASTISRSRFSFVQDCGEVLDWWWENGPQPDVPVFRDTYRYLRKVDAKGVKPNFEQRLNAQFSKAHQAYETAIQKADLIRRETDIQCAFPKGGIYDSTITRLLLMSSSENHVQSVPMAFFVNPNPINPTKASMS